MDKGKFGNGKGGKPPAMKAGKFGDGKAKKTDFGPKKGSFGNGKSKSNSMPKMSGGMDSRGYH